MLLNKNNLSIGVHCTPKPVKGYASDVLHITEKGTLAVNGPYSVAVSALETHLVPAMGVMSAAAAAMTASLIGNEGIEIDPTTLPSATGHIPPTMQFFADKPPLFDIKLDTNLLLLLAKSAEEFGGNVIRLQFTGVEDPVRIDTNNSAGQTWEALLMPRTPGLKKDIERFK